MSKLNYKLRGKFIVKKTGEEHDMLVMSVEEAVAKGLKENDIVVLAERNNEVRRVSELSTEHRNYVLWPFTAREDKEVSTEFKQITLEEALALSKA